MTRLANYGGSFWVKGMDANGHMKCAFCGWQASGWMLLDDLLVADYVLLRYHVLTAHPYIWLELQHWLNTVCLTEDEIERRTEYHY